MNEIVLGFLGMIVSGTFSGLVAWGAMRADIRALFKNDARQDKEIAELRQVLLKKVNL